MLSTAFAVYVAIAAGCGGGSSGSTTTALAAKPSAQGSNGNAGSSPATPAISAEKELLAAVKDAPEAKLGPWLMNLHQEYLRFASENRGRGRDQQTKFETRNPVLRVENGMVAIEATANDPVAFRGTLTSVGATDIRSGGVLFSARVPVSNLGRLSRDPALRSASPVLAKTNSLPVPAISQGVQALFGLDGPSDPGIDGTGVRIAALSDSFGCEPPPFLPGAPTSTVAEDQANDELPTDVVVAADACPGNIDEGRAMLQLIHDVAPGASQAFHTAFVSGIDFACGIMELGGIDTAGAAAACGAFGVPYSPLSGDQVSDVIVDDVIYFAEPMFMPGQIAQAADTVYAAGIPYFSSAGNDERLSYEAEYNEVVDRGNFGRNLNRGRAPGPNGIRVHDFSGSGDTTQTVTVSQSGGLSILLLSFQWDQPHFSSAAFGTLLQGGSLDDALAAPGASTDMDALFYDRNGILVPLCPPGVATGITCQITGTNNRATGDAVDIAALIAAGPFSTEDFQIRIVNSGGPAPGIVKYVAFELQGSLPFIEYDTRSGTSYGHANAAGAASIGAAAWYATEVWKDNPADPFGLYRNEDGSARCAPACAEDFSSAGGIPILFDALGNPIAPFVPDNPLVTGPDGGNTTFFLSDSSFDDDDSDTFNNPFSSFLTPPDPDPASEYPNFFGTSASAPHVAAVAGLMLQKNPGLTPQEIYDILASTAQDMSLRATNVATAEGPMTVVYPIDDPDPVGFDYDTGYGYVDAEAALNAVPAP